MIKIQTNKEEKLTLAEKRAVKVFLLAPNSEEEAGSEVEDFNDMIARLEEEAKAPKAKSKYRSLAHISPTSVVVEGETNYDPSSPPHGSKYARDVATTPLQQGFVGPLHS